MKKVLLFIFIAIFFISCSSNIPTPNERKQTAINLYSNNKNIIQKDIQTSQFNLFSLQDIKMSCSNIKIFVEGDGLSWISRTTISSNPTPITPDILPFTYLVFWDWIVHLSELPLSRVIGISWVDLPPPLI